MAETKQVWAVKECGDIKVYDALKVNKESGMNRHTGEPYFAYRISYLSTTHGPCIQYEKNVCRSRKAAVIAAIKVKTARLQEMQTSVGKIVAELMELEREV